MWRKEVCWGYRMSSVRRRREGETEPQPHCLRQATVAVKSSQCARPFRHVRKRKYTQIIVVGAGRGSLHLSFRRAGPRECLEYGSSESFLRLLRHIDYLANGIESFNSHLQPNSTRPVGFTAIHVRGCCRAIETTKPGPGLKN